MIMQKSPSQFTEMIKQLKREDDANYFNAAAAISSYISPLLVRILDPSTRSTNIT